MVINRSMAPYSVFSFTTGTDDYGELRQLGEVSRSVDMSIKYYQHSYSDDIRYEDINYIGLTAQQIEVGEQVEIDNHRYDVKFVNSSGRMNIVYLQRVN